MLLNGTEIETQLIGRASAQGSQVWDEAVVGQQQCLVVVRDAQIEAEHLVRRQRLLSGSGRVSPACSRSCAPLQLDPLGQSAHNNQNRQLRANGYRYTACMPTR